MQKAPIIAIVLDKKEKVWYNKVSENKYVLMRDGARHICFLATNRFRDPTPLRHAALKIGAARYDVTLPFGFMLKCVTDEKSGVWAESEDGEVLSINDGVAAVLGTGIVSFCIVKDGKRLSKQWTFHYGSEHIYFGYRKRQLN